MKTRITLIAAYPVFIELAKSIEFALIERFNFDPKDIKIHGMDERNGKEVERFDKEDVELTFILKALRKYIPSFRAKRILFQTEELWNRREMNSYFGLYAPLYDRCLEMYDENINLRNTKNVVYCPVGYSPVWESKLEDVEEDIDVLFHGSITPRRVDFQEMLVAQGLKVNFTSNAFGEKRNQLIKRSKIDINIKAHDKWSYGPMHCLPAQANKNFMLAEKANGGYGPFKAGIHVAEYDGLEDCKEKVLYWLSHNKERKEFAVNAYEDMVKNCHFNDIFEKAMGPCREKNLGPIL
jgi:hypothetical protein